MRRIAFFSTALFLLIVFSYLCWSAFAPHHFDPAKSETFSGGILKSGFNYAQAAQHLQYHEHDPAEVHRLFQQALLHAPADAALFLSYFQYLMETGCCVDVASKVIHEAVARDPYSPKTLSNAIHFFLGTGQKAEALQYIKRSAQVTVRRQWLVNELAKSDLTNEEVAAALPKTENGLATLEAFVSKRSQQKTRR